MRQCKIVCAIIIAVFCNPLNGKAQNPTDYVYEVLIPGSLNHSNIVQTGFKLSGVKGIVTCLHGVCGASSFSAYNSNGDVLKGLSITYVDVKNDLALLQSNDLLKRGAPGLELSSTFPASSKKMKVLGHPAGIAINEKTVSVGYPNVEALANLIPTVSAPDFVNRDSPSPQINVLYLEGNLVPGESGAPLLGDANEVYGVIDGGIGQGAAGISWAIPLNSIQWENVSLLSTRLSALSRARFSSLFSYQDDPLSNPSNINKDRLIVKIDSFIYVGKHGEAPMNILYFSVVNKMDDVMSSVGIDCNLNLGWINVWVAGAVEGLLRKKANGGLTVDEETQFASYKDQIANAVKYKIIQNETFQYAFRGAYEYKDGSVNIIKIKINWISGDGTPQEKLFSYLVEKTSAYGVDKYTCISQ